MKNIGQLMKQAQEMQTKMAEVQAQLEAVEMTGAADFRADAGSGRTPRNGAGSIATVTAEDPVPAILWAMSPPKECPTTAGLMVSWPIASR